MTASSRLAKTLAAATALTVHGLALWAITPDIEIEILHGVEAAKFAGQAACLQEGCL